jgi:hypothetical protein
VKVRINRSLAGHRPDNDKPFSFTRGKVENLPREWAEALIEGGAAEAVGEPERERDETATDPSHDAAETRTITEADPALAELDDEPVCTSDPETCEKCEDECTEAPADGAPLSTENAPTE